MGKKHTKFTQPLKRRLTSIFPIIPIRLRGCLYTKEESSLCSSSYALGFRFPVLERLRDVVPDPSIFHLRSPLASTDCWQWNVLRLVTVAYTMVSLLGSETNLLSTTPLCPQLDSSTAFSLRLCSTASLSIVSSSCSSVETYTSYSKNADKSKYNKELYRIVCVLTNLIFEGNGNFGGETVTTLTVVDFQEYVKCLGFRCSPVWKKTCYKWDIRQENGLWRKVFVTFLW